MTINNKLCAPNIIVYTASWAIRDLQLLLHKRRAASGFDTIYTVFSPTRGVYDLTLTQLAFSEFKIINDSNVEWQKNISRRLVGLHSSPCHTRDNAWWSNIVWRNANNHLLKLHTKQWNPNPIIPVSDYKAKLHPGDVLISSTVHVVVAVGQHEITTTSKERFISTSPNFVLHTETLINVDWFA